MLSYTKERARAKISNKLTKYLHNKKINLNTNVPEFLKEKGFTFICDDYYKKNGKMYLYGGIDNGCIALDRKNITEKQIFEYKNNWANYIV